MKRRTLDELLAIAQAEINRNPTITVYTMRDDGTEDRRRVKPWLHLHHQIREAVDAMGHRMKRLAADFAAITTGFRNLGVDTTTDNDVESST